MSLASSWAVVGGTVYLKDAVGLSETALAPASVLQLFNGAKATRAAEVQYFSSVQFGCQPPLSSRAVSSPRLWQQARHIASAHGLPPTQALMLQVARAPQQLEAWSVPRSLAVDALQLLVVLTAGVATRILRSGTAVAATREPSAHIIICL